MTTIAPFRNGMTEYVAPCFGRTFTGPSRNGRCGVFSACPSGANRRLKVGKSWDRNTGKWSLFLRNRTVRGFRFEKECRRFLEQLREQRDGRTGRFLQTANGRIRQRTVEIAAAMISCRQREPVRRQTLAQLTRTDRANRPVHVHLDRSRAGDPRQRLTETYRQALQQHVKSSADYLLVFEDDLGFNARLYHNLARWAPVRTREVTLASLYDPGVKELACGAERNAILADPKSVFGSQALLVAVRLTGRLGQPVFFHAPSLVQHLGVKSTWGGRHHRAWDFDRRWVAGNPP